MMQPPEPISTRSWTSSIFRNGGWDASVAAMYNTTWYNDSGDSVDTITEGSFNGWHTVVIVVSGGHVKYYDGTRLLADHSGKYYPRSKMNIIPQLWFSDNNAAGTWHIDVDWVYYWRRNAVLTAAQVEAEVDGLRASGVAPPEYGSVRQYHRVLEEAVVQGSRGLAFLAAAPRVVSWRSGPACVRFLSARRHVLGLI